jgi:hypothetical protein
MSNSIVSAGSSAFLGARITNNTGVILTSFTLEYNGEQWRDGGAQVAQLLDFDYSLNATSIQDGAATFTDVNALDFASPVFNVASGPVDGNSTGRVAIGPVTVNLNWLPGTDLWIRWRDLNNSGNDHGLAIDDLKFSALPEPGSLVLLLSALLALVAYRRRG